jgi:hypothetical protein
MQTGHHRFTTVPKIRAHWSKLIGLLHRNPDYKKFLDDKGTGEGVPEEYLIAVEEGLQSFGTDPDALGKFAMKSATEWHKVEAWRKRECYIAAARFILGLPGYLKYIGYRWSDYVSRTLMAKTFKVRHLQYTNGTAQLNIPDPECWDDSINHRARAPFRRSNNTGATESSTQQQDETDNPLLWDSENDEWVEQ